LQDAATRVDFYVLESASRPERLNFVCRLTETAYKAGNTVYLLAASSSEAVELNKLLWTFRDDGFVPHNLSGDSHQASAPIMIGHEQPTSKEYGLIINLANPVPADFDRFQRIAEIIDASATVRQSGRQRFTQYRAAGIEPDTHKIGGN
jgi:DNA polymerase-3 subunit chi